MASLATTCACWRNDQPDTHSGFGEDTGSEDREHNDQNQDETHPWMPTDVCRLAAPLPVKYRSGARPLFGMRAFVIAWRLAGDSHDSHEYRQLPTDA